SAHFAGFFIGCWAMPRMIGQVGHSRAFAAAAAVGATGVILNVTAVNPAANGFVTVFPCGTAQPEASNLNYRPGENIPNAVVARVGTGGEVCFFTLRDIDLVVDVNGFVP
ncbi:MAG: hypothetical protein AAFY28_15140, partial [Actinomycetota bacterium]